MNRQALGYILFVVFLAAIPVLGIYPIFAMKIMCYALFACAFNLLLGFTGLLSFGHAAFLGGAAYASGHAIKAWGFSPELGILYGVAIAGVLGVVMGALAIRRSGIYFAMITMALSQMVYFYFLQAKFTGGEDGLQGVPRGTLFGLIDLKNDLNLYYVVMAIFILGYLIIWRTVHSPFGQVLKAIRENEPRAISLGYDVERFKLLAFVLSALLAGLAGSAKMLIFVSATLSDATWQMSGLVILMTLNVANNILLESSLTFLGLGVDPMIPSWGGMLADGRTYMQTAWWVSVFPGLAIMLTVLGLNLLGDWLRDRLDPTGKV